jgi:hypothetical protein
MHVQLAADGKWDLSPAAIGELVKGGAFAVVREDDLQGKTITDAYAIGDRVFIYDKIVPEGGGTGLWIEGAGTEAKYFATALESTGGALAANTHVKARWNTP